MNQEAFEARLLHLWMTTRVPLTRANVLFFTQAPRRKADRWLEALVEDGVLEFDSDDHGEMLWMVRGAERPDRGPEKVEDVLHLEQLRGEVHRRGGPPSLRPMPASRPPGPASGGALSRPAAPAEKSLLVSGALSLIFGPAGWLYAGHTRESLPAMLAFALAVWALRLLPFILAGPAISLVYAASGALGVLYAWEYNKHGQATPLLGGDDRPRLSGRQ